MFARHLSLYVTIFFVTEELFATANARTLAQYVTNHQTKDRHCCMLHIFVPGPHIWTSLKKKKEASNCVSRDRSPFQILNLP